MSSIGSERSYSNHDYDLPIVPPPPKELSYPPSQVSSSSFGCKKLLLNGSSQSLDLQSTLVTSITLPSATPTPEVKRLSPSNSTLRLKRLMSPSCSPSRKPPRYMPTTLSNPQLKNLDALQRTHREHKNLLRRCLSEAETGPAFHRLMVNCNNNRMNKTTRTKQMNGRLRFESDGGYPKGKPYFSFFILLHFLVNRFTKI